MLGGPGRGSDDYGSLDYYNMMRVQNVAKLSKNGDSVGTGTGRVMHSNYGGGYSFGEDFGGQCYGGINPNMGGVAFGGPGRFWTGGPGHMVEGRISKYFQQNILRPFNRGGHLQICD